MEGYPVENVKNKKYLFGDHKEHASAPGTQQKKKETLKVRNVPPISSTTSTAGPSSSAESESPDSKSLSLLLKTISASAFLK